MSKKFISIILVIVISFTAFISAPVSVYASVGGYSWEDYYDLDSSGNYTFNDAFYDLSTKAKVYVILDTLQNADDKVTAEYIAEDKSAVNALSYIAWVILSSSGVVSDFVSNADTATSIVSVFVDLFDSGEISARSGGGFTVSSSAVNTIRETYVDDYRLLTINNYNVFSFGSVFAYDDSNINVLYNTGIYDYYWSNKYVYSKNDYVFVPTTLGTEYYGAYGDFLWGYGRNAILVYSPNPDNAKTYAGVSAWHITKYATSASNLGKLEHAYSMSSGSSVVLRDILVNYTGDHCTTLDFSISNLGSPYSYTLGSLEYVLYNEVDDEWYWVPFVGGSASDYICSDSAIKQFCLASGVYQNYTSDSWTKGAAEDYYTNGYAEYYSSVGTNNIYPVMLRLDSVLVDDLTGTTYTYNSCSDYAVSDDALEDGTDGDSTNSPSITIDNDSITNLYENYDSVVKAISEDDSVSNVSEVIDNYSSIVVDDSGSSSGSDDSDDDSGSSSGSSGSDDDSSSSGDSSGTDYSDIISWLKKIYNKLCSFYDDTVTYLSSIFNYMYVIYCSVSDLSTFVSGDLYSELEEIYTKVSNSSSTLSSIYSRLATTNTKIDTTNSRLADIIEYVKTLPDDLAAIADSITDLSGSLSDIVYYLSYDSDGDGWLFDIASSLADGESWYFGYGILEDMYVDFSDLLSSIASGSSITVSGTDYSSVLSSLYNRLDDLYLYFTGDLWELLTNLNNYVVYLYEEVSAFPETLAQLFSDYFMDSYYVSQTVFEIIRGDLDLLYQMLAGDTDSVLSNMQDSIDALAEAIASITSEDSEVSLSGIKGHLKVIETLLTGIAALMAVDTVVDLLDFTSEELGDYLDTITDSIGEVTDAMTDVFPFCIPWDILAILALFAAEPEAPVFEWPFDFDRLGVHYTVTIDFSEYENIAMICRTILTCLFVVGLGYLTIRITGGSGGGGDED